MLFGWRHDAIAGLNGEAGLLQDIAQRCTENIYLLVYLFINIFIYSVFILLAICMIHSFIHLIYKCTLKDKSANLYSAHSHVTLTQFRTGL